MTLRTARPVRFWTVLETAKSPLLRISTSLSAVYIGVAMLAYPDRNGAMDSPMWGVAMVFWGTAIALLPAGRFRGRP